MFSGVIFFYVRGVIAHMISRYGSIKDIGKAWGNVKLYANDRFCMYCNDYVNSQV